MVFEEERSKTWARWRTTCSCWSWIAPLIQSRLGPLGNCDILVTGLDGVNSDDGLEIDVKVLVHKLYEGFRCARFLSERVQRLRSANLPLRWWWRLERVFGEGEGRQFRILPILGIGGFQMNLRGCAWGIISYPLHLSGAGWALNWGVGHMAHSPIKSFPNLPIVTAPTSHNVGPPLCTHACIA